MSSKLGRYMRINRLRRREFITLLGGGALACPLAARAQQSPMPVVGFIRDGSADANARYAAAFRKGLNETGTIEGQNVTVEYHWLEGQLDRSVCSPKLPLKSRIRRLRRCCPGLLLSLEQAHRRARSYLIYRDPKLDRYQSGPMKFGITHHAIAML